MPPSYKLTYFHGRGRGEVSRILFAQAAVEYVDNRIEMSAWPALKPSTPFGHLPILEVDGVKLCQSNACERYLARKFNLAGRTDLEQAQADMFVDCFADATKPILLFWYLPDAAQKVEPNRKYNEEQLPGYLAHLEAMLKQNHDGDGYLVGTELTWADIWLLNFIGWTNMVGNANPLAKFPKLKALKEKVEKLPKIAAWLAKRPKTEW